MEMRLEPKLRPCIGFLILLFAWAANPYARLTLEAQDDAVRPSVILQDDEEDGLTWVDDELSGQRIVTSQLVVSVHKDVKREDLEEALKAFGEGIRIEADSKSSQLYLLHVPQKLLHALHIRLGTHPYVESCCLNTIQGGLETFNDPALQDDNEHGWNLRRIRAFDAWDITTGGAPIGIVDSGIKADHEEFSGKVIKPYSVITRSETMQSGLVKVDRGGKLRDAYVTEHGCHVAGTAAGKAGNKKGTAGIAPASAIIPIQALGYDKKSKEILGQHWQQVLALHEAMNRGARVINFSVGGPPPANLLKAWKDAANAQAKADARARIVNWSRRTMTDHYASVLDRALREGVIVVKSAGNDDLPAEFDPMSYSRRVLSVAATGRNDQRAQFNQYKASNYGEFTTVSAPGQEIWNAYANPDTPYGTMQGTSMAAPHVTGLVALMKTVDPDLSRKEAADILRTSGARLSTDKPIGPRIDAFAALKELKRRRDSHQPRPDPDKPIIDTRPDPSNPELPKDGLAICRRPRPWQNPDVRRLIDLWLAISLPALGNRDPAQGPFIWDRFGRVVSVRVVYVILPPDYAGTRYQWLWQNRDRLQSRNFGNLSTFVTDAMKRGRFLPNPPSLVKDDDPKGKPSAANGVHAVTTNFKGLATTFKWEQVEGADSAKVTFTMNGPEGSFLRKYGLPATVTVTAKKQGGAFVVSNANPMSTALTKAGANASQSVGGKPANVKVAFTFTPNGKKVTMQSKISF